MPSIKGFKSDACCHVFYSILFLHWMPFALQLRHCLNLRRGLCAAARISFVSGRSWGLWTWEGLEDEESSLLAKRQDGRRASLRGGCAGTGSQTSCLILDGLHASYGDVHAQSRFSHGKLMKSWSSIHVLRLLWRSGCARAMPLTLVRKCWISALLQRAGLPIMEVKLPGNYDWIGTSVYLPFVLFICSKATAAHLQMCVLCLFEWVLISERCRGRVHSWTRVLRMWSGALRAARHDNKGGKLLMNLLSKQNEQSAHVLQEKSVDTGLFLKPITDILRN